jgi:hypothetical protein
MKKPDDVAVGVPDRCNQPSDADSFDLLLDVCTSIQEGLETLLDMR